MPSNIISLVIPPEPTANSNTLESQIQQIILQKGHFRNVSEKSLLAEISGKATASDASQADQEDDAQAEEDESPQKTQERLWERRKQMTERLRRVYFTRFALLEADCYSYAQNEVLCALDLISWLISQQSVPARHSMSAALKEAVPVGTLVGRSLEEKPISPPLRRHLVSVSQGWRSEGFRSASEKLSAASSRLQTDAEHEAQFWHQVADLTTLGWRISRLPRDHKAIGVHFGFAEAAQQFRDRGFALLRQATDGSVNLDARAMPKKRKHLAVYVVRDGVKTGASHFTAPRTDEAADIKQQLRDCRDALFEEELFYEICREARLITNQGISTRAQTVEVDVCGEYRLLLVSSDEPQAVSSTGSEDDSIANFVAIGLRLLLSAAHEQTLLKRSQKAPPMTPKARTTAEYALIRPILTHLRHRAETRAFWNSLQVLLRPFKKANLPADLSLESSAASAFESLRIEPPTTILSELMKPAKTAFQLTLSAGRKVQIGLATFLGPPLVGTRYETSSVDFGFSAFPFARHETREAIVAYLQHMLLLDLVARVEALTQVVPQQGPETHKSTKTEWRVSQPHAGELMTHDSQEAVYKIEIFVHRRSMGVKFRPLREKLASKRILWLWTSTECSKTEGNTIAREKQDPFDEAVKQLLCERP